MGFELTEDTKHAFRVWLESKGETEVVGHCRQTGTCPLAEFLSWGGHKRISVTPRLYWLDGSPAYVMPGWAQVFVERVDRSEGFITAGQALKLLPL